MKKIKNLRKYKRFVEKKNVKSLKRRLYYKKWRKHQNRLQRGVPESIGQQRNQIGKTIWEFKQVSAPRIFSLNANTEQVIEFLKQVEECYNKKLKIFVVLRNVEEIDYGALIVLLSIMVKFKAKRIKFNGDFPKSEIVTRRLIKSGFFENLNKTFRESDTYQIAGSEEGGFATHADKRVDPVLGDRLIKFASKAIWSEERRCQGIQRILLELMQNTNNHAEIGKSGEKHWWVSVNHLREKNKVCFAFVDFGVGVFRSLDNKPMNSKWFKWSEKMQKRFKYGNNADLLQLMLDGKFHETVTGKYFRGKGLPGIADVQKRNQISRLIIITNDAYCSLDECNFKTMSRSFTGTYVYWEVSNSNASCK
jgi:hypothetical protein